jgi:Uncharacterized protein conserved in bacteria (DUF2334)
VTADEQRTARLLFADELAAGTVSLGDLDAPEVRAAAAVRAIPSRPRRLAQRIAMKRGRLTLSGGLIEPAAHARRALLGDAAAAAPPKLLIRIDEFPHATAFDPDSAFGTDAYRRFDEAMRAAGLPYLVAVMPRVAREPYDPQLTESRALDAGELAVLRALRDDSDGDRVAFACHGLDHRTRHANPRRHTELGGLGPAALQERLDRAHAILAAAGVAAPALVPPFNRFDAGQWDELARRFDVVTGGPESVAQIGFHPGPQWRGEAVYLPSYAPLYGTAEQVTRGLDELGDGAAGLWLSITLHWAWEARQDYRDIGRLADRAAGSVRPWTDLYAAVQASRMTAV